MLWAIVTAKTINVIGTSWCYKQKLACYGDHLWFVCYKQKIGVIDKLFYVMGNKLSYGTEVCICYGQNTGVMSFLVCAHPKTDLDRLGRIYSWFLVSSYKTETNNELFIYISTVQRAWITLRHKWWMMIILNKIYHTLKLRKLITIYKITELKFTEYKITKS